MTEFTRYLYLKEEVEVAMLMSLLHGDKERALFWAYELYYSGLVDALLLSLWRIYYEFYAMLNPALETYLKKKQKEVASNNLKAERDRQKVSKANQQIRVAMQKSVA